ncbi:unnamed protein product (macronuclear) [Paramecium tetraurelia]|uniref:ABC transporter family protein n=1 Tax=Paramecium tetraurelia TaxID=5888 RepID=A0BQ39_PARTE|nr:uncharacterized protein GSPATT00005407001 [Paramecium tetraurelia]CAK60656.1 unnamed protein product [Paramecium tetraurelia]|eukprot:XP_001428054.1 hypothetical protein (macronuclear) [Paramecium tetraurelia strain d4-2]
MSQVVDTSDQISLLEPNKGSSFEENQCHKTFFFSWVYPILKVGKSKPLTQFDLISIDKRSNMSSSYQRFISVFNKSNLALSLFNSFRKQILICLIAYLIVATLQLCLPIITAKSQKYFMYDQPEERPLTSNMFFFAAVQLIYMLSLSLIKPFQQFFASLVSIKIQGALQQEILLKTLRFPISRSQHYSTGELINMLQVDITQTSNYFYNAIILYTCPIQLACAGIVFFVTLGDQALVPALGAIVQAFIGLTFGYFYGLVQKKYMMAKDLRMKAVDEALLYSKQVKLNQLEDFFEQRIHAQRTNELYHLKNQVIMLILIQLSQGLVGIFTWEILFFVNDPINFAIVAIMMQNYDNIVRILEDLPMQFKNYSMSKNSIDRIENFFNQKECNQLDYAIEQSNVAIDIQNCSFDWESNDKMNKEVEDEQNDHVPKNTSIFNINLNIQINKGQYVAFVGNSASGKSTILRSILGETHNQFGKISVNGRISVATQDPWIISGTIKKNITFMNQFDSLRYKEVIKCCGLERDIASFKNGDETVLGEKGDNLSGGQQKRINLARAVYNDADIYLLDDPMSALDIKVKYQINQQCIQGYLKNKTRVLFTNSLSNLQECDMIYIVEGGKIIKQGKFAQIIGVENNKILSQKEVIDIQFEEKHYTPELTDNQDLRSSLIQKEDQEKGQVSKAVQSQIFSFIGRYCAILCAILYFAIVLACQLFGNFIMAQDDISDADYKVLAQTYYPFIQAPIIVAMVFMKSYYLIKGLSTSKVIHDNVMNSLLNASYTKFYNTILIGRLMNRLSKDIYSIDLLFPNEIQNLTYQCTSLLLPLFACFLYLNIAALPLLLLFFIILLYLTIIYYRCLREITRIEAVSKSPVFSFFQQIVRGVTYVRSCLPIDKVIALQQKNVDIDLGNQINLYGFQYWYQSLAGSITNCFQAFLFIICVNLLDYNTQKMTNLVLQQMQTVSTLLLNSAISYGNIQMYFISFERCLHLAKQIERNHPLITPSGQINQASKPKSDIVLKLENCTFQYRSNSKSVLQQMSLELHKGEKIGVVGRTGAGKSSIILALTAILEQIEGQIEIEDQNINSYSLTELRQKFSIIPQDPLIFMGTLRENLDPLNQFSEARILEVAQKCRLFEMQSFKKYGLQSEIALSGSNLSQGEKQLLNITRCILEDKQIILVDEATANIDQNTEEHVKEIFENYFQNAAMLTIAHKVTTIMNSDRIMVLNDGKISEFDHPQKLLADPNSEFKLIIDLIKQSEQL